MPDLVSSYFFFSKAKRKFNRDTINVTAVTTSYSNLFKKKTLPKVFSRKRKNINHKITFIKI